MPHAATTISPDMSDIAIMEATLEIAAARCEDITPLVFARFFAARPDAEAYFQLDELDPQARGRMLVEVLVMLTDAARGEGYVRPTMTTLAADHISYGIHDASLYDDFLSALRATLADLLEDDWTDIAAQAWMRQCAVLQEMARHPR